MLLLSVQVRRAVRPKVSFQTSLEDLEGRVLLSSSRHHRPPPVHVHVRVVRHPVPRVRLPREVRVHIAQMQAPTINIPVER